MDRLLWRERQAPRLLMLAALVILALAALVFFQTGKVSRDWVRIEQAAWLPRGGGRNVAHVVATVDGRRLQAKVAMPAARLPVVGATVCLERSEGAFTREAWIVPDRLCGVSRD